MIIRCYSGRTVAEALTKVKNDLGENALIVETRSVKGAGVLAGTVGYEIVAALEHSTPTVATRQVRPSLPAAAPTPAPTLSPTTSSQAALRYGADAQRPAMLTAMPAAAAATAAPAESGQLSRELAAIRAELGRLASGRASASELPDDLNDIFVAAELPDDLQRELAQVVTSAGDRLAPARREVFLHAWLTRSMPCVAGIDWATTRHLLIVGPTGVGKTTTLAKLAAQLVHGRKARVGIITIDTYRIGAQDQLRAYADLLDVPFAVASTPAEFTKALAGFADCDHVLIDTAGRSPADAARVHELRAFCRAAAGSGSGLAVMLALPATCGRAEFAAVVERFSVLPLSHTVVTKLDECAAAGRLYGCLRRHALQPAYFTTGQEVPDDIATGNARLVVDRIFARATVGADA